MARRLRPKFLVSQFAACCLNWALLDASRYFIILPDNIAWKVRQAERRMTRTFQYEYDDMVLAQHNYSRRGWGQPPAPADGYSMGCMHSWIWPRLTRLHGRSHAAGCLPSQSLAGTALAQMVIDGIRGDPDWKNGEYSAEPRAA